MLEILDAAAVRYWCQASLAGLVRAREEIDAINVYPVADSDTGTNLLLTMEAAAGALARLPDDEDLGTVLKTMADGALIGARGNSGVIVSQLLRGLASGFGRHLPSDGRALAAALEHAADLGYRAVGRPVEGTILTVARAAAEAAAACKPQALGAVAAAAAQGADRALAATPDQLEVLRRAGVVDAGGRGLCVLYAALAEVVTGVAAVQAASVRTRVGRASPRPAVTMEGEGPAYEVMYLLEAPDDAIPPLRELLATLGDSVVVVGGDRLWNVHVHLDDPGPAVEAGITAGRPYRIKITSLGAGAEHGQGRRAVVAMTAAPGIAELLAASGGVVVAHEPGSPPTASAMSNAIQQTGAGEVVLIPDGEDAQPPAEAAAVEARAAGLRVAVIPARSCVQAIAALAVHDPAKDFDADVIAMSAASGAARHAELAIASAQAVTSAGVCQPGDVLGLIDGDVALIGSDLSEVAHRVLGRILDAGGEMVTLVSGRYAPDGLADDVVARLHRERPEIECVVYRGGQADHPLLIGVE